jgi:broad specificity phosphatase PhoE
MYTVDLVRHTESAWVEKADAMSVPVFGGRMLDVPLSQRGRKQARAFGEYQSEQRPHPHAFFASTAVRTVEMHELAMEAYSPSRRLPLKQLANFVELDWGEWEGQPRSILGRPQVQAQLRERGLFFRPPGGESFRDVRQRALVGLVNILSSQPPGSRIVVFTHKNVIKSLVSQALGWTVQQTFEANVLLGSVTRLHYKNPDGFRFEFFNRSTPATPR